MGRPGENQVIFPRYICRILLLGGLVFTLVRLGVGLFFGRGFFPGLLTFTKRVQLRHLAEPLPRQMMYLFLVTCSWKKAFAV